MKPSAIKPRATGPGWLWAASSASSARQAAALVALPARGVCGGRQAGEDGGAHHQGARGVHCSYEAGEDGGAGAHRARSRLWRTTCEFHSETGASSLFYTVSDVVMSRESCLCGYGNIQPPPRARGASPGKQDACHTIFEKTREVKEDAGFLRAHPVNLQLL